MDEYDGSELTFSLLDELARATVRGRVAANEFLASRHLGRVGPLMELLLLDRTGTLPLSALPDCQTLDTLWAALSPSSMAQCPVPVSAAVLPTLPTTQRTALRGVVIPELRIGPLPKHDPPDLLRPPIV